jgi:hypothetical protein
MFTLVNPDKSLAEARNFAHTQETGLNDPTITAEEFTERMQLKSQKAYAFVSDRVERGAWPLTIDDLKQAHETMCEGLQTIGGKLNLEEVPKYEASCKKFVEEIGSAISQNQMVLAMASHTARCEGIQLFEDHNSGVHRIALEANMDMVLGKAQRPGTDQEYYQRVVQEAQMGKPEGLASLIQRNHDLAMDAKRGLPMEKTQTLGPDVSTNWRHQDPGMDR